MSTTQPEFAAFVAIDWADQKHFWHLADAAGRNREHGHLLHKAEQIDEWVTRLCTRFAEGSIAVGLEQSRGALAYQLSKYGRLVLYPIHPTVAARFREALYPSGSKGDPSDAGLLLELLLHHRQHLRPLEPDTAETRLLRLLVELRRRLVNERTRQSNRLTAWLKIYFPQALEWIDNIDAPLGCDFLERWPTLQRLQRSHSDTIENFFREHNSRSKARIRERIEAIGKAVPAVNDPALLEAGEAASLSLAPLLRALNDSIANLDQLIAEKCAKHPEANLFSELPGAGPVITPRLIVAFGTRRERYQSALEVASYSGIAPITRQSGNSKSVRFRFACPKFLRQTFHEFAACSVASSPWAKLFYQQQKARGKRHHVIVRALALKWIRVLFRCWKDRTPYDQARYLKVLEQRHPSPKG